MKTFNTMFATVVVSSLVCCGGCAPPSNEKRISTAKFGESTNRGGVTVSVTDVSIERPDLVGKGIENVTVTPGLTTLTVRGSIRSFRSRGYGNFALSPRTVLFTATSLERVPGAAIPDGYDLSRNKHRFTLKPGEEYQIALAFEVPPEGGEDLVLELDGMAVGLPADDFSFTIPREMIGDSR